MLHRPVEITVISGRLRLYQLNGRFWVTVSMGRRNTRLKPSILVFGPDGFVGAS